MTEQADASILRKTRIDHIATEFERVWRLGGEREPIEHALAMNGEVPRDELLRELLLLEIELRQGDGQYVSQSDYRSRFSAHSAVLEWVFAELKVPSELTDTLVLWSAESITDDGSSAPEDLSDVLFASSHHATLLMDSGARPAVDVRPRVIGDFELIDQIDEGGMGVVYKARQKSLNRIVALKLIKSGALANADELRRFRREAEAAAKLNHPNILPVYEFGKHGDSTLYIAMPFIQGKTLRESLGNGTMTPRASAELLLTLVKAMAHAHERQILHRDLKPNNILIDEKLDPLILDFGLACDVSLNEQLTQSGQIMGAPGFMPPEQAGQQNGKTDFRSDIYALGAILYYTLRGVAPFTGASGLDVIQRVLNDDPVSPRADDQSIPRDLETICLKCLRKEKEQRYQTANELAADLQLFLEGKPIIARPLPVLERVVRWCRRRPWQAALIGLLIAFAATATATAGVMTQLRKEERDARQLAEGAALDAQDATVYALEHQIRAQLSASDPAEIALGVMTDTATQPASVRSVDNALVEYERAYSLPKVLNSAAGDWGYFDFRPSPSGHLLAVCDHAGVVQILDESNGRELHRLANATIHPDDKWNMHLAFFESEHPRVKELNRPAFTFSLDWVDETTLVAVDDQKRLLKYSLAPPDKQKMDQVNAAEPDVNQPAADQVKNNQPEKDQAIIAPTFTPAVLSELSEPGHLVRVRSSDGAVLVCLESGAMNLFDADGASIATNAETASRPMNCQYHAELQSWIVGFDNGDVVMLDSQLTLLARLSTGSPVYCVSMSRSRDQWVADLACAHRPIVRYAWNSEAQEFTEIARFDIRSRMYDHYFVVITPAPDARRLFARDTKGNIVAWMIEHEELLGMFNVTQSSNPWLDGMKVTLKWPPILNRNPAFLDTTSAGRLRAVDDMGVIMEFATDGPPKPSTWKTLDVRLGADPSLAAVNRSPHRFWALDAAGTLSQIDAAEGTIAVSLAGAHPGPVPSLVAMSDGCLVTVSGDRTIRVWSTDDEKPHELRRIEHDRNLISLAVHDQERTTSRIAAMDESAIVSLWDPETGRKVMSASMPEIAFPDDPERPLAERNAEAQARKLLKLSTRPYTGKIAFNRTGQYLAAFGVGQQFDILDCSANLKSVKVGGSYYDAGAQGGTALCWSGTNDWRLIAGDEFGTAKVWVDGQEPSSHVQRLQGAIAYRGHPVDCRETPDKGRLGMLMRDGRLLFMTSSHFVPTTLLDTGVRTANSFCIGGTGQTLMVAGRDGTLRSAVFADFSLPEETKLRTLTGTRHELLAPEEKKYPKASSLSLPALNSNRQGTLPMMIADDPAGRDGELFLIRRREDVWRLDAVTIPNSPRTEGSHVFFESPGVVFSNEDRPVVALRQVMQTAGYDGRLLLAREQADKSWETEVVLNNGNEGHTCFPVRDPDGEVNSVLHFDYGILQFRHSRRGPLIDNNWPTETLAKGRGFRLNGFQSPDGTVHVCGNSIRGGGDYAPDRYLIMTPGEPLHWEYAPGQILMSLSDGTPVITNINVREAAYGNIYRRNADDWEVWTRIPGSFSDQRILSRIFITTDDEIWLADYRQAARRLYAWNFSNGKWSCYEIEVELPDLISTVSCWVESKDRLAIVLSGVSQSEAGGIDVIDTQLPNAGKAP